MRLEGRWGAQISASGSEQNWLMGSARGSDVKAAIVDPLIYVFLDFRARSPSFMTDETIKLNRVALAWVRQRARLYRLRGRGTGRSGVAVYS
ncbi:hypothetical protein BBI10_12845 [Pseudomonas graminis]|uniref:Uncharacterized protein n=1 Tax=Pseudomonas graminis TaxID=158627 RepID=A0A1C2E0H8_9PSED|nr:hypothetical protein BBI10_12845 [Pseudomonas graminis]